MATQHECGTDCKPVTIHASNGAIIGRGHQMYAQEPSSAAGRYQWEINQRIFRQGAGARKAYRATGQDQTRNCRVWEVRRANRDLWSQTNFSYRRLHRAWLPVEDTRNTTEASEIFDEYRQFVPGADDE